ncbi:MAG: aminotransferase class III-fold pyridoxal phosphate-dependent enzyme, partial [Candidatus Eremiobacteraeota bacterium]|nr:aminotransferase class III-fold pyridoxal phosphate-dependent enzyme [Candidatus Eremiobacteraeota bacterium]
MTTSSAEATLPSWLQMGEVLTAEECDQSCQEWLELTGAHINRLLAIGLKASGNPFVEWRSEGIHVYRPTGEALFDCLGAGGVFGLGFRHPQVVAAVKAQLDRCPLSTRMGVVPAQAVLAKKLLSHAPAGMTNVFFGNSGTESVEAAIKLARLATGRSGLIGTHQGYHGMSTGTISLSGLSMWRDGLGTPLGDTRLVAHGKLDALERTLDASVAAVVLEPIQWASGCRVAPPDYFQG